MQISLCMIVKNEEDVLARCLDSAKTIADEIIIVDTGSTDRTKEIASQYTRYVYDFEWVDDFSAARNFSFSKASMEYCMWLDADDVILPEDQEKIRHLKQNTQPDTDVVMMLYHGALDEQGKPSFSYYRERIVRNSARYRWQGAVHEAIAPSGTIIYSTAAVTHRKVHPSDPDRNLHIFEVLLQKGEKLQPREQFYYARELYYHQRYQEAVTVLETFLEEGKGWVENKIEACRVLSYCYDGLQNPEKALEALLKSLAFDEPRAEVCCEIGAHFLTKKQYHTAAYWYQVALSCQPDESKGNFVSRDCYGFLPCIQLCVCYDRMDQPQRAEQMNELAAKFRPAAPQIEYNRNYFLARRTVRKLADS